MLLHELSIALSIVDGVLEEAEQQGGLPVAAVHLCLGPLSGVDEQALSFAYLMACQGTPLEGSRLVVQRTEVALYCPVCERECTPAALHDLRCPICGSCNARLVRGTELEIRAMEIIPAEEVRA
jgi:hydrogenase nickel incorporation protein HypA/HybF